MGESFFWQLSSFLRILNIQVRLLLLYTKKKMIIPWWTMYIAIMREAFSDKKANTCSLIFFWKNTPGHSCFPWKLGKLQYCRIPLNNRFFHAQKYGTKAIWMFTFSNGLITIYAKGVTAKPVNSGHLLCPLLRGVRCWEVVKLGCHIWH